MPSTTTLYTTLANVVGVSSNNYTTLYNSTGDEIFSQVPYGNSNVEAFLNAGTDGSNTVQNINMSGTITVGGESNLGPVGNVHISGGGLNYVLTTDGGGHLSWTAPDAGANLIPFLHFDVVSTGNNQTFTDTDLELYTSNVYMNVMKNGVNIEPTLYEKTANDTIQINILLNAGDTIDVLATSSGSGGQASGNIYEVQINDGVGGLTSSSLFTYTPSTQMLATPNVTLTGTVTTTNIDVTTHANLGDVGNVYIGGGTTGQVLTTDGAGNLTWDDITVSNLTIDVANLHVTGGTNGYVLQTDGSGNLSWTAQTGGGGGGAPGGANRQIQYNNAGVFGGVGVMTFNGASVNFSNVANLKIPGGVSGDVLSTDGANNLSWTSNIANANVANYANYANFAGQVVDSNQPNITSLGTLIDLTVTGNANIGNVRTDNLLYANGTPWPTSSYGNADVANYLPTFNGNLNPSNLTATVGNITTLYSGNVNITGGLIQSIKEPVSVVGTSVGANTTIDLITNTAWYYTSPLYNNTTLNIRGNSTVTTNTMVSTNESITFSTIFTNSANLSLGSGIVSNVQIDGTTQTIHWVGAPPSATLDGLDVYAFTLIKTAANTYTVIGSRGSST